MKRNTQEGRVNLDYIDGYVASILSDILDGEGIDTSGLFEFYADRVTGRAGGLSEYDEKMVQFILVECPDKRVVEVGAGIGALSAALALNGIPAVAVEYNHRRARAARQLRSRLILRFPEITDRYEFVHGPYPQALNGSTWFRADVVALFTNVVAGWDDAMTRDVIEHCTQCDSALINLEYFGKHRETEEERKELFDTIAASSTRALRLAGLEGDFARFMFKGTGEITRTTLAVPREHEARFNPQLIADYQRRFPGFNDKIISMYARGMGTREIAGHLCDLYSLDVSAELISTITDAVPEETAAWQSRPLEAIYPLVFFDALRVKIRDEGLVHNRMVHIALGVRADGAREILGLWLEQNGGAKFWLRVMNELKNRGIEDLLVAVVDGLKGFPEAVTAVFPQATVQTCIVHLLRRSLHFVSGKDRKPVAAALKAIFAADDAAAGELALGTFEDGRWGQKYPAISQGWRRAWSEVVPFYAFPGDVRRMLYTTNAIEALNFKLRQAVRARGHFPSQEAATELLLLVLNRSEKEWTMPPREWALAKSQFGVLFGERFTAAMD